MYGQQHVSCIYFCHARGIDHGEQKSRHSLLIPIVLVCLPIVLMMKPFSMLDLVESGIANLMSVSMSVMLIGMVSSQVVWVIQCALVVTELLLLFTLIQEVHKHPVT